MGNQIQQAFLAGGAGVAATAVSVKKGLKIADDTRKGNDLQSRVKRIEVAMARAKAKDSLEAARSQAQKKSYRASKAEILSRAKGGKK